jgi:protein ImuB
MPAPEVVAPEVVPPRVVPPRIVPPRIVTVWFPDWPVVAAGFAADVPAAVMFANRVVARTPAAAEEGVAIGQRRRQAQARCPHVELVEADRAREAREFESIIRAVAELSPRLDVVEPGWITLAARGPSRYFGGDQALCERLGEIAAVAAGIGVPAGIGVADGRFASSVAARLAIRQGRPVVVDSGGSAGFCAPLPIGWLQALGECQPELIDLFVRLGLRRLGDLAALAVADVLGRFGHPGMHAHQLAAGTDERPPSTTDPAPERRLDQVLDDPVAQAGAVVFVAKQLADELVESLAAQGRVCTRLVVLLETEHGERSERSWYRSAGLSASAMIERVRWQLDAWVNLPMHRVQGHRSEVGNDQEITGGISLVRLTPEEIRADDGQQLGLWGGQSEADRQAARAIARLTTLTSEAAVTVPVFRGGRLPADRYEWVPATTVDLDRASRVVSHAGTGSGPNGPWPGSLPSPSPATVLAEPIPAEVVDEHGAVVEVSGRGMVSSSPASLCLLSGDEEAGWRRGRLRAITAWAGPWPVEERWWEPQRHRRLARFQVLTDDQCGYLVVAEHRRWWISARYD